MSWEGRGLAEDEVGGKETELPVGEEPLGLEVFHHGGAGSSRELYKVNRGCRAADIK